MKAIVIPLVIILFFAYLDLQQVNTTVKPWVNTVITPYEMDAIGWVLNNTKKKEVFLTCIFEGEFLMGMTLREATEGGDWAIVPDIITRMSEIDSIFKTNDSNRAYELTKKYNASYVWLPLNRQTFCGYGWFYPNQIQFNDSRFIPRFRNNGVVIYEIK